MIGNFFRDSVCHWLARSDCTFGSVPA
jgi:hypothetical protein